MKEYFAEELTTERVAEHMNELIALEMHPILRLAPLELKNLGIKAGARYAERDVTAIFSNMSAVKMPAEYEPFIERFGVYTSTPKMELCMCSFGDKLSLGFTSRFDTINIQRTFYRILKQQGIGVEKVEPEFPQPDVPSRLEMKVFKFVSFLCLAAAVGCVAADFNLHPKIRWTLFTAAGIGSMWLALAIGFVKRYNLMKNAMWQLIIVTVGCILWDIFTGWRGWSVDFVLPIVCMVILVSMFIITKVQKNTAREYMIYFVMAGGLFHVANDIERIGDHAENFADSAKMRIERHISFSEKGVKQLQEMMDLVEKTLEYSFDMFANRSQAHMAEVIALEDEVDEREKKLQKAHVKRLTKGKCSPEAGMIFSDTISGLERVADHATNIAFAILEPQDVDELEEDEE